MAIWLTFAPALLVALHGKLEPSGVSGELSGVPYGTGVFMIMWALAVVEAMAMAMRIAFNEGIMVMNDDLE